MVMLFFKINHIKKVLSQIVLFLFLLILSLILIQADIFAQEELIAIDEIYSGMKGIGKTVFSGTKIEEFDVQVIDIITGTGINHPYILVKLSGEKIDENVGISAGMSGTPVYLEGKLAGAISHAWEMSDHNLCLVTPIDRMIALFDYTDKINQYTYSNVEDYQTVSISLNDSLQKKLTENISGFENAYNLLLIKKVSSINFQYIQSPLLISGLEGRAHELLESNLVKKGAAFIQNFSEYQDISTELEIESEIKVLKPGSAVGVQLSTGDASVLTIGTVTYCKDDYLLAFGHPFMHQGKVSYLLSAVYIYHSFPSIVMPFKIGSPYRLLGEVIQDRDAGILAQLNHFPRIVSCRISVSDMDRDIKINSGAKIVPQNDIMQSVTAALLIQSVDRAIDRIGQGTAVVRLEVRAAQSEKKITQENMFFSKDDIAVQCGKDFDELLDLMINNYSERIDLSEVKIDITIREQNQSAIIKEIKLNEEDYYPGDTVEAQIIIKPFRKSEEIKIARIELPDEMAPGEAILIIRGGSSQEITSEKAISQDKKQYLLDGWEDIQEHIKKKVKNNQIIAELILINERGSLSLTNKQDVQIDETEIKTMLDTDFVVEGYHEMYLNIKSENNLSKDQNNE